MLEQTWWLSNNIILKNMFLVNVIVLKYNGIYPFLEHRLSIFCKTFCNHPFLKEYYIYFWRSLTGIHCVLTMYFRFIAVFLFGFWFFCQEWFVFIYFTTLTAVTYQIKWIVIGSRVLKKYSVYLRKPILALIFQWCLFIVSAVSFV